MCAWPVLSTHPGWTGTAPYFRPLWPRCDTGMQMLMRVSTSSSLLQLSGPLHFCPSFSCSNCIMGHSSLYCIGVPIFFFFLWQLCQCLLTIFCLEDFKKIIFLMTSSFVLLLNAFYYFLCRSVCLHVCLCIVCMPGDHRNQKNVIGSLGNWSDRWW